MRRFIIQTLITGVLSTISGAAAASENLQAHTPPPEPVRPLPKPRQLDWHERGRYMFLHFTVNTFTDMEWGNGKEDPQVFNPTSLDARQWVKTAKDTGFEMVILTCKHHDGFCLWPSKYTDHTVAGSPWKNGEGDVVREVSDACREFGIDFGVYLSPWDRHEPCYGDSPKYNQFYRNQLTELLTNYGEISMVWFDGACGEGPNGKRQVYDWDSYFALVRKHQPGAVIFSDAGPGVRWVGNEAGYAGDPNWAMYDIRNIEIGGGRRDQMTHGNINGNKWVPAECDVSIRPGWFYHKSEDDEVKSLEKLFDIYLNSTGNNSCLNLNVPPDRRGLLHENDVQRLREFSDYLNTAFNPNLLKPGLTTETGNTRGNEAFYNGTRAIDDDPMTYWATDDGVTNSWLTVEFEDTKTFNIAVLREYVRLGQRVAEFELQALNNGQWETAASGHTIGFQRIIKCPDTTTDKVRLLIKNARACPTISVFELYNAPDIKEFTNAE
ncbi:MAG: alpha-L-fucosidase [Verrucomicrobia bacterium]|nr:alpha-L-fucosidase [Verrucomicrobiota bacterium]